MYFWAKIEVHKESYLDMFQVSNGFDAACHSVKGHGDFLSTLFETIKLPDIGDDGLTLKEDEFDDCDIDDEIDPALKEKIDRSASQIIFLVL